VGQCNNLSLLINLSHADIQALQTVDRGAQKKRKEFILKDDLQAAWRHLKEHPGRVDIVPDNAGFELYTDLLFADFLISHTALVTEVVFHPKGILWFISGVVLPDVEALLSALENPSYSPLQEDSDIDIAIKSILLRSLAKKWKGYFSAGKFKLSVERDLLLGASSGADYWTLPRAYWNMHRDDPATLEELSKSSLVIFKGYLNYRKLTGDVKWPVNTSFESTLGPLNGRFPILSLRINKSDAVVGVSGSVAASVEEKDPKWRVNSRRAFPFKFGKIGPLQWGYALVSFTSTTK